MTDRRSLLGIFIFLSLILICFLSALLLLSRDPNRAREEGPSIGVVPIQGVLVDSKRAVAQLRRFARDESIEAIVVRINSPGGSVGPAQEIYREIIRVKKKKKVVASMGAVAASGGYYIAAACHKIVANPGTLTGSIGVISQTTDLHELVSLARIKTHTFKSGALKDTGSPLREMLPEEQRYMQAVVDQIHRQFIRDVTQGRGLKEAKIKAVTDGRVLTGEEALRYKLVDRMGNFTDAMELAVKLAGSKGDPVAVYPRVRRSLLAEILADGLQSIASELRGVGASSTTIEVREPSLR